MDAQTDITQQLRQDIGDYVNVLLQSGAVYRDGREIDCTAERIPYDATVHFIAGNLNGKYVREWQSMRRKKSFRDEVSSLLLEIMREKGFEVYRELRPHAKNPFSLRVRQGRTRGRYFVRANQ